MAPNTTSPHTDEAMSLNSKRTLLSWSVREQLTPYAFLAPTLVALGVVFAYPMAYAIALSFYQGGIGNSFERFVGFQNYVQVVSNPYFTNIIMVSVVFSFGIVLIVWPFGLVCALMLNQRFPGRTIARTIAILPWASPFVSAALVWGIILNFEFGILNQLIIQLPFVDERIGFLSTCPEALISVTGVGAWRLMPFSIVMFLAALQTIPPEYYEAAEVDGAGPLQSFWYITLPGVRGMSVFLFLLILIWTFGRAFAVIYILTGGGPGGCTESIPLRGYIEAFQFFNFGTAAALGTITLMISLMFSVVYLLLLGREKK